MSHAHHTSSDATRSGVAFDTQSKTKLPTAHELSFDFDAVSSFEVPDYTCRLLAELIRSKVQTRRKEFDAA